MGIAFFFLLPGCRKRDKSPDTAEKADNPVVYSETDTLYIKSYSTTDGLISSDLLNVYSDNYGYVWIASGKGIMRFDGLSFTPFLSDPKYGIPLKGASAFYEDSEGVLWVFSGTGHLFRLNSSQNEFVYVKTKLENGWLEERPMFIEEADEDYLWLGGYGGIQRINRRTDSVEVFPLEKIRTMDWPYPEKLRMEACQKDKEGNLWLGTRKFGLVKFDIKSKTYEMIRDLPRFNGYLLDDWVTDMVTADDGTFWISDYQRGLVHFDPINKQIIGFFEIEKQINSPFKVAIRDMCLDGERIWLATNYHGFLSFNLKSKTVDNPYNLSNSDLPHNQIKSVTRDISGNIWLAGNQLSIASPELYTFKTYHLGQNLPAYNLTPIDRGVLATTAQGIYQIRDGEPAQLVSRDEESYFGILKSKSGDVWAGKTFTALQFDSTVNRTKKVLESQLVIDSVGNTIRRIQRILEDSQGTIWMIDDWNRLKMIKPKTGEIINIFELAQDPVSKKFIQVQCFLDDPENRQLLVGTDLGLVTVNYDSQKLYWPREDPGLRKSITYLYRGASGTIWSVISSQIYEIDLQQESLKKLKFDDRQVVENFNWMVEYPSGMFWLQSSTGIIQFDGKVTSHYPNKNFSEGSFGKPSPVVVSGGKIYFGGESGVTVIDPGKIKRSTHAPKVHLKALTFPVSNRKGQLADTTITPSSNVLHLDYTQNRLSFEWIGLHFKDPENNLYRYRMEGYDRQFRIAGEDHKASYTNLNSGNYRFIFSAGNSDGVWAKNQSIQIVIHPPWYNTWWARISYLTLFSIIIYGWIRYRVFLQLQKYKATEEMRTTISADLHDDVGSLLAGLSMKAEVMAMGLKPVETESLQSISDMARQAMERMRDTVWAIDSRKDKYENLIDRMNAFAQQMLTDRGFRYQFMTEGLEVHSFISPILRQNLYLILKEAVTNIIKHSNGDLVEISLQKDASHISLRIKDNGEEKERIPTDGLGISNMQARASKINGILKVGYQNGYQVSVTVPYDS